jgi:hypothetical protein
LLNCMASGGPTRFTDSAWGAGRWGAANGQGRPTDPHVTPESRYPRLSGFAPPEKKSR